MQVYCIVDFLNTYLVILRKHVGYKQIYLIVNRASFNKYCKANLLQFLLCGAELKKIETAFVESIKC